MPFQPDEPIVFQPEGEERPSGYDKYVAEYQRKLSSPVVPRFAGDTGETPSPMLSKEEWQKKDNINFAKSVGDRVLGVPDALFSFASKIPSTMAIGPSYLYGRLRGKSHKEAEDIAATIAQGPEWSDPKTTTGERILNAVGTGLQAFGPEPYSRIGTLRAPMRIPKEPVARVEPSIAPKPVEPAVKPFQPEAQTGPLADAGERAFNDMALQQLEGYTEPIPAQPWPKVVEDIGSERARLTQLELDKRQTALEFETKKQQTADFNAAERARQEAAPLPAAPIVPDTPPTGTLPDNVTQLEPPIPVPEVIEHFERPKPNLGLVSTDFNGQRGANRMLTDFTNELGKWAGLTKDSPEVAVGRQALVADQKREVLYNSIPGLDAFRPIWDKPEKVLASVDDAKDLGPVALQTAKSTKPGIRSVRVSSNHPFVGFVQKATSDSRTSADAQTRTHLTNPTGAAHLWEGLSKEEQVQTAKLLKQGSDELRDFTPEEMAAGGYSPKQIAAVQAWYKAKDHLYDYANGQLGEVGKEGFAKRPGWMPGVFEGDFWSLVMEDDKVVGYVGTNTKAGYNNVVSELQKENPRLVITPMKKRGLEGNFRRSDLAAGMSDIMTMLAKNDPKFADVQARIQEITKDRAHAWLGAELHTRDKKGIFGTEGNKPWEKDAHKSAQEMMKAAFKVWEEEMLSYTMLPKTAEITALANNPEVMQKWPRAVDYVNDYMHTAVGSRVGQTGQIINNTVDLVTKAVSFDQLGPTAVRGGINQYTKRMGQLTQGFGNVVYTGMQWLQPFQTALPEYFRAGSATEIAPAQIKGIEMGAQMMYYKLAESQGKMAKWLRSKLGDTVKFTDDEREIFKYAEDKGLLTFSEFDDVSKTTQSKVGRLADKAIDYNRNQLGERPTRPVVFFTFVDLLRRHADIPEAEILPTAYELTQYSMHDYHPWERPLMYQKLGVVGQLAGNLKQYMHSYIDQTAQWAKEAPKKPQMLLAGLVGMATLQGYKGAPGYEEFDNLVKYLTGKFGDKQVSIGEIVSKNAPDWLKQDTPGGDTAAYGALSASTGINFSSRLGSAQVLPDSAVGAVSPYAEKAVRFGQQAAHLGRNPRAPLNMALELTPSSVNKLVQDQTSIIPFVDDKGALRDPKKPYITLGKRGELDTPLSDFDRKVRRFGLTSLDESKYKDGVYQGNFAKIDNQERRARLTGEAVMKFNQLGADYMKSAEFAKLRDEYVNRGGDPEQLVNAIVQGKKEASKTSKQRAEGTHPSTIPSIRRYQYYND